MIPFSLLPHWFQRRYRVWRRLTRCWRGEHRERVMLTTDSCFAKDGTFLAPGAMVWFCSDCERTAPIGNVIAGSNHKARRDA